VSDPYVEVREEAFELASELGISGDLRLQMLAEPERAVAVLRHARSAPGVRNPAALAVVNWRNGFDPRRPPVVEKAIELPPPAPPSLSALEYAWSLDRSEWAGLLLRSMSAAIALAGGFENLQRTFRDRERFELLDD
jgi:hypothetical protein